MTIEQLEAEIKRRKTAPKVPKMLPEKEVKQRLWDRLAADAYKEVSEIINSEYCIDNDNAQYTWEAVMQAFYGDDFFEWYNSLF